MSTLKFLGSTVLFAALLLVAVYGLAYLTVGGPQVAWWALWGIVPAGLLFGLIVTVAIDDPIDQHS